MPHPVHLPARSRAAIGLVLALVLAVSGLVSGSDPASAAGSGTTAAAGRVLAPNAPQLGPNVYVFDQGMSQADIQTTVNDIAARQVNSEFGPDRYALLFRPGTYGSPGSPLAFQVGYYTEVAGLGAGPGDVVVNGTINVYNQCRFGSGYCIALTNFWRSLSNLTINVTGGSGCRANTNFWAVSQAAPMRRVDVNGKFSLMDYCTDGPHYSSGGFIADTRFRGGELTSGSQQQFIVRNSELSNWSNGVWNQVFAGTPGAPATSFGVPGGPGPYTTLDTTPVSAERPFLVDTGSRMEVHVPPVRHESRGLSWTGGSPGPRVLPLSSFLSATPQTSVATINDALAAGRNVLFGPGIYRLAEPIRVTRADTVVLGLGLPTLIPTNGNAVLTVADVAGVRVSGVTADAGTVNSPVLVRVGTPGSACVCGGRDNPVVIQDLFVRIGGMAVGRADLSLEVNSSNVLLDHIWAWRGDHGAGIGWTENTAATGVVVNGHDVTAVGLFVEHYQRTQTIWRGERGRVVLYQNELPYDPPNQAAWQESADSPGYPALEVASTVTSFRGWGLGAYSYFNQNQPITARMGFRVPRTSGVQLRSVLTVFLDGSGSVRSVVNDVGAPVDASRAGQASNVIAYP